MSLLSDTVHVWRSANGMHHLAWDLADSDARVDVEVLTADEPTDPVRRPGNAQGACVSIAGLCPLTRHRFRVSDDRGTIVDVAARGMGLQGAGNFRDFGGYPTQSGGTVGWGHLYRSGNLSALSPTDIDIMARLDIDLVCDFRREDEQRRDPSRLPLSDREPRLPSLPITPGSQASALYGETSSLDGRDAMFAFMVNINREFVRAQSDRFGQMFAAILEQRPRGLILHCAAGKDRTGFGAALLLSALGVSREHVLHDYLLTRHYFDPWQEIPRLRAKYSVDHLDDDALLPMLGVDEAYLGAAYAAIAEGYGSMDTYLKQCLGVGDSERKALAALYLAR